MGHRLGHKAEAQTALDQMRKLMQMEPWAKDQQSQIFATEAERLVQGSAGVPEK
jgi:hypothetical protein